MGKFGWDYPPGCTQAMVDEAVGCGPEEVADAFADAFFDEADKLGIDKHQGGFGELMQWVWKQIGEAYGKGYAQANADHALAEDESHQ